MVILLRLIIGVIVFKFLTKMDIGSTQLGKKDMEMVMSTDNGMLLYAKQMAQYLLVIFGTILFNVLVTEENFY
jgi:hypothetical protein